MKVYSDGKNLLLHEIEGLSSMNYNKTEMKINLVLDGLSYANTSKPIEEDDRFYMEYHPVEERF